MLPLLSIGRAQDGVEHLRGAKVRPPRGPTDLAFGPKLPADVGRSGRVLGCRLAGRWDRKSRFITRGRGRIGQPQPVLAAV